MNFEFSTFFWIVLIDNIFVPSFRGMNIKIKTLFATNCTIKQAICMSTLFSLIDDICLAVILLEITCKITEISRFTKVK